MDLATALTARRVGDRRPWIVAALLSIDTTANRAVVSIDGSEAVSLPFVPGNYSNITTVFVVRDNAGSGSGDLVVGPCYQMETPLAPPPEPPPAATPEPQPVTDTALIRPVWSGTYRSGGPVPGWDQWNVGRYGGRSTLYQGNAYGSGPLTGLAVYGSQVQNLGALSIQRIVVSTPLATGSGDVELQGSPHGSKPSGSPARSGPTSSGRTAVELDAATCEEMRTGSVKGLASVGASYRGTRGTSHPSGMALQVTYTRPT